MGGRRTDAWERLRFLRFCLWGDRKGGGEGSGREITEIRLKKNGGGGVVVSTFSKYIEKLTQGGFGWAATESIVS